MLLLSSSLILLLLTFIIIVSPTPLHASLQYILVLDNGVTSQQALDATFGQEVGVVDANTTSRSLRGGNHRNRPKRLSKQDVNVHGSRNIALIELESEQDKAFLMSSGLVTDIVPNNKVSIQETTTQWNLDRIDQQFGMDGTYLPTAEDGTGIDIYILDTGVQATCECFGGRVQPGKNILSDFGIGGGANVDCNGHGTHVASTAAGEGFGLARGASIVPVLVLGCDGQGTVFHLINGITWVRDEAKARSMQLGRKAIINMSVSALSDSLLNQAVASAVAADVVVVVAAGNYMSDACGYSPAGEVTAITVGATSDDDSKLPSSNFGSCVDLVAPGDTIVGASNLSPTGTAIKSGTSMATPLVVGFAAMVRQRHPTYTALQVRNEIVSLATAIAPAMDADCGGYADPPLILQTYGAALRAPHRPVALADTIVPGARTNSDFNVWLPELSLLSPTTCVTFSARVSTYLASPDYASLKVTLSTKEVPLGYSQFADTAPLCRDLTVQWYVFEAGPRSNILWSNNGGAISTTSRLQAKQMDSVVFTQFYVSAKPVAGGIEVKMGNGDGSSDAQLLARVVDTSKTSFTAKRVAFSAQTAYDLEIQNVMPCAPYTGSGGGGIPPAPSTNTPTSVVSSSPAPTSTPVPPPNAQLLNPNSFSAPGDQTFSVFPPTWDFSTSQGGNCFQFQVKTSTTANIGMFDRIPTQSVPASQANTLAKFYQLSVGTANKRARSGIVTLLINGNTVYVSPAASKAFKLTQWQTFRFYARNGVLGVSMLDGKKNTWSTVVEWPIFGDDVFDARQLSLAGSSASVSYAGVTTC